MAPIPVPKYPFWESGVLRQPDNDMEIQGYADARGWIAKVGREHYEPLNARYSLKRGHNWAFDKDSTFAEYLGVSQNCDDEFRIVGLVEPDTYYGLGFLAGLLDS